jgi:hypothetical protein
MLIGTTRDPLAMCFRMLERISAQAQEQHVSQDT